MGHIIWSIFVESKNTSGGLFRQAEPTSATPPSEKIPSQIQRPSPPLNLPSDKILPPNLRLDFGLPNPRSHEMALIKQATPRPPVQTPKPPPPAAAPASEIPVPTKSYRRLYYNHTYPDINTSECPGIVNDISELGGMKPPLAGDDIPFRFFESLVP